MVSCLEKLVKIRVFEHSVPKQFLKRLAMTVFKVKLEISAQNMRQNHYLFYHSVWRFKAVELPSKNVLKFRQVLSTDSILFKSIDLVRLE